MLIVFFCDTLHSWPWRYKKSTESVSPANVMPRVNWFAVRSKQLATAQSADKTMIIVYARRNLLPASKIAFSQSLAKLWHYNCICMLECWSSGPRWRGCYYVNIASKIECAEPNPLFAITRNGVGKQGTKFIQTCKEHLHEAISISRRYHVISALCKPLIDLGSSRWMCAQALNILRLCKRSVQCIVLVVKQLRVSVRILSVFKDMLLQRHLASSIYCDDHKRYFGSMRVGSSLFDQNLPSTANSPGCLKGTALMKGAQIKTATGKIIAMVKMKFKASGAIVTP